jgi:glycosyltransferase involved in cell wall biosynthesis
MTPDLTFVIPLRNEEQFIERTCRSLASQELDGDSTVEVLLLDGMSTDRSAEICRRFEEESAGERVQFRLLSNPEMRTPFGFNRGIEAARAGLIGLGGAHTDYPPRYFAHAIHLMKTVEADVYGGGHTDFIASAPGPLAEAMSCLYQSPMGSGVAPYHRRKTPGYVDTVYGGFYRREVFDRVGMFNTRLAKNQDNELNSRVTAAGMRIYFDPALSTAYVFKTDPRTFFKRAFSFGRYHPTTWRVNRSAFKLRHVIPAGFVVYLLLLVAGAPLLPWWACIPLALYGVLLVAEGIRLMARKSILVGLLAIPLFFGYHVAYGAGTLLGLDVFLRRNEHAAA